MSRLIPTRPRARVTAAALVAGVVLVLVSPVLGRADVNGSYRPVLPPDGLTTGCYPLPGGVVPDFAYVLRRDGETLAADAAQRFDLLGHRRGDAGHREEAAIAEAGRVQRRRVQQEADRCARRGEPVPHIGGDRQHRVLTVERLSDDAREEP